MSVRYATRSTRSSKNNPQRLTDGINGQDNLNKDNTTKRTRNVGSRSNKTKDIANDTQQCNNTTAVVEIKNPKETTKLISSPRKQKSRIPEQELAIDSPVTPPKQKKDISKSNVLSPSSLLNKLNLNSPPAKLQPAENKTSSKSLFSNTSYQNARKALHSAVPTSMPGREKEHTELFSFINEYIQDKTAGTLYISGPPGTGKTASLSVILQNPDVITIYNFLVFNKFI